MGSIGGSCVLARDMLDLCRNITNAKIGRLNNGKRGRRLNFGIFYQFVLNMFHTIGNVGMNQKDTLLHRATYPHCHYWKKSRYGLIQKPSCVKICVPRGHKSFSPAARPGRPFPVITPFQNCANPWPCVKFVRRVGRVFPSKCRERLFRGAWWNQSRIVRGRITDSMRRKNKLTFLHFICAPIAPVNM